MQTNEAVELIQKSDLAEEEKKRLIDLIEKEGVNDSTKKEVLAVIDKSVDQLKSDIEKKRVEVKKAKKYAKQEKLVADLIYLKMLKQMKENYDRYEKDMSKLEGQMDDTLGKAVKMVEEDKAKKIKEDLIS